MFFANILKKLLSNPMGMFVYGILSKWYFMALIPIFVVTYWVLKGLSESGILNDLESFINAGFLQIKAVAQHCAPKMRKLSDVWDCLQNTPPYVPEGQEPILNQQLQDGMNMQPELIDNQHINQNVQE